MFPEHNTKPQAVMYGRWKDKFVAVWPVSVRQATCTLDKLCSVLRAHFREGSTPASNTSNGTAGIQNRRSQPPTGADILNGVPMRPVTATRRPQR